MWGRKKGRQTMPKIKPRNHYLYHYYYYYCSYSWSSSSSCMVLLIHLALIFLVFLFFSVLLVFLFPLVFLVTLNLLILLVPGVCSSFLSGAGSLDINIFPASEPSRSNQLSCQLLHPNLALMVHQLTGSDAPPSPFSPPQGVLKWKTKRWGCWVALASLGGQI